ncbi:MAG TPA: hypothetical protein VMG10_02860 [Gemmataceae bacterium]|nr:hypothetical protein [Gemmataceae bacterium]
MRLRMIARCWGVFLSSLLPSIAWANIGPQWLGDRTAEPLGLKGVAIIREKLTIDLRPLSTVQPVEVEAIYHLNNSGSAKKLALLFITGVTGVSDFEVRLDGRLVQSRRVPPEEQLSRRGELPKSWQPPDDMPGIDSEVGRSHSHRRLEDAILLAFVLELPPGRSTLSARYRARAYGEDEDYPTVTWLFPYILAPAREWQSFGGLDVTVYLPETWQFKSKPDLEREGGVLRGRFTTLPADCLALAVRTPMGPELQEKLRYTIWWCVALYLLVVMSGGILCCWAGRLLGRFLVRKTSSDTRVRNRLTLWIIPFALLMTVGWEAAILGTWGLARESITGVFAGQESPYFREQFILPSVCNVCFIPFVLPAGFLLARGGARSYLRHAEKQRQSTNVAC